MWEIFTCSLPLCVLNTSKRTRSRVDASDLHVFDTSIQVLNTVSQTIFGKICKFKASIVFHSFLNGLNISFLDSVDSSSSF